jgi:hypothetical protein
MDRVILNEVKDLTYAVRSHKVSSVVKRAFERSLSRDCGIGMTIANILLVLNGKPARDVTSLAQLEQHLDLSDEERSGVLLSGDKLALAITPHFFNLIPKDDPDDPIRRQVIPRIEETWSSPYDMADPCGEDSHMPVPGLAHRYPDLP